MSRFYVDPTEVERRARDLWSAAQAELAKQQPNPSDETLALWQVYDLLSEVNVTCAIALANCWNAEVKAEIVAAGFGCILGNAAAQMFEERGTSDEVLDVFSTIFNSSFLRVSCGKAITVEVDYPSMKCGTA